MIREIFADKTQGRQWFQGIDCHSIEAEYGRLIIP